MNPAAELHDLLSKWATVPKGQHIQSVRSSTAIEGDDFLAQQVRAGWLLGEAERAMSALQNAGDDMSAFRTFLPKWWDAVFLTKESWQTGSQNNRIVIGPETLAMLKAFAAYLSKSSLKPFEAAPESLASSRAAIDDIISALREQDDLNDESRVYVFGLADEIRSLLDATDARVDIDLIRRINELRGWLGEYAAHLYANEPDSAVARTLRRAAQALAPTTKVAFAAGGYALGVVADTLSITQVGQ